MSASVNTTSILALVAFSIFVGTGFAQERNREARNRRSDRVHMPEVQVASPDDQVKFTVLPDAERLIKYKQSIGW